MPSAHNPDWRRLAQEPMKVAWAIPGAVLAGGAWLVRWNDGTQGGPVVVPEPPPEPAKEPA